MLAAADKVFARRLVHAACACRTSTTPTRALRSRSANTRSGTPATPGSWISCSHGSARTARARMLVYNQGAMTNGPFRLNRYPSGARELRRLLASSRFPCARGRGSAPAKRSRTAGPRRQRQRQPSASSGSTAIVSNTALQPVGVAEHAEQRRAHAAEPDRQADRHPGGHAEPARQVLLAHHDRDRERRDRGGAGKRREHDREHRARQQEARRSAAAAADIDPISTVRRPKRSASGPPTSVPDGAAEQHRRQRRVAERLARVQDADVVERDERDQAEVHERAQRDHRCQQRERPPGLGLVAAAARVRRRRRCGSSSVAGARGSARPPSATSAPARTRCRAGRTRSSAA